MRAVRRRWWPWAVGACLLAGAAGTWADGHTELERKQNKWRHLAFEEGTVTSRGEPGGRWEQWRCLDGEGGIDPIPECAHHDTPPAHALSAMQQRLERREQEARYLAEGILWITNMVRYVLTLLGAAALMAVLGRALVEGKVSGGKTSGVLVAVAIAAWIGAIVGFVAGGGYEDVEAQVEAGGMVDWTGWTEEEE